MAAISSLMSPPTQHRYSWLKSTSITVLMVFAALFAIFLTPTKYLADKLPPVNLAQMVPDTFGDWKVDDSITPVVADPSQAELINRIYSQTLSRTYVNRAGDRIMLAIAYGRDQSEAQQVHTPEACYPAQGFKVTRGTQATLNFPQHPQAVVQLIATRDSRVEPITYWVTVGSTIANSSSSRRDERIRYGLVGVIPDGTFFRVSSIGRDSAEQYKLQEAFLTSLFMHMQPNSRTRLFGAPIDKLN